MHWWQVSILGQTLSNTWIGIALSHHHSFFFKLTMMSVIYWHAVKNSLLHINVKKLTLKTLSILDYCALMRINIAIVIKCKGIDQKHTKSAYKHQSPQTNAYAYICIHVGLRIAKIYTRDWYTSCTNICSSISKYQNILCDLRNNWQLKKVEYWFFSGLPYTFW